MGGHQPTSLDGGEGPRWGGGLSMRVGWGRIEVEMWWWWKDEGTKMRLRASRMSRMLKLRSPQ